MSDKYILITKDNDVYYFDETGLFNHLNNETSMDEDGNETSLEVLEYFPVSEAFGSYCPFYDEFWKYNQVFIYNVTKNAIFIPNKKAIEQKVVVRFEYIKPSSPRRRKPAAKKAAASK